MVFIHPYKHTIFEQIELNLLIISIIGKNYISEFLLTYTLEEYSTLQNIENDINTTPVTILNDEQLLELVNIKHEKFIKDYSDELHVLDEKIDTGRSSHQRIVKELEALESRIIVLREKRHQLYHQVKKLYEKLIIIIKDSNQIKPTTDEINNILNKLQNTNISSNDEYSHIDRIVTLIKEIEEIIPDTNTEGKLIGSSVIDLLETARMAQQELEEIESAPKGQKNESDSLKQEYEELEPRRDWLNRRIKLHTDALDYWGKMRSGGIKHE